MTEKKTLTIIRTVRLMCVCGEEMRRIMGSDIKTKPPKFPHQCLTCKRKEISEKQYPYLEYEENPDVITVNLEEMEEIIMNVFRKKDKVLFKTAKTLNG